MPQAPRRAFTLIELLIVVAIIAILAAIAVPNFLEAQTRSKVSRVKADMRTIATAMEAYLVDNNKYVCDSDNTLGKNGEEGLARLTTPIAYLTSLPFDPFQQHIQNDPNGIFAKNFELGSGSDHHKGWSPQQNAHTEADVNSWLLISVGTDATPVSGADDTANNDEWPWGKNGSPCTLLTYDPTNGTVSDGDIYRVGGSLGLGNYYVNGQKFGNIAN